MMIHVILTFMAETDEDDCVVDVDGTLPGQIQTLDVTFYVFMFVYVNDNLIDSHVTMEGSITIIPTSIKYFSGGTPTAIDG